MDFRDYRNMDTDILVSLINMKLRDFNPDLDDFLREYDIDKDDLLKKMKEKNYSYHEKTNQFRKI